MVYFTMWGILQYLTLNPISLYKIWIWFYALKVFSGNFSRIFDKFSAVFLFLSYSSCVLHLDLSIYNHVVLFDHWCIFNSVYSSYLQYFVLASFRSSWHYIHSYQCIPFLPFINLNFKLYTNVASIIWRFSYRSTKYFS